MNINSIINSKHEDMRREKLDTDSFMKQINITTKKTLSRMYPNAKTIKMYDAVLLPGMKNSSQLDIQTKQSIIRNIEEEAPRVYAEFSQYLTNDFQNKDLKIRYVTETAPFINKNEVQKLILLRNWVYNLPTQELVFIDYPLCDIYYE